MAEAALPSTPVSADYVRFVGELKERSASARTAASRSVNRELILLYWDIGKAIVDRQQRLGWGESVVEAISRDLRDAFPGATGFSARSLCDMKRFFRAYTTKEFGDRLLPKVGLLGGQRGRAAGRARQSAMGVTIY